MSPVVLTTDSLLRRRRGVRATAPIRICDNGGWTDTRVARHGKVFNIAVTPRVVADVQVFARGEGEARVIIAAENYGARYAPNLNDAAWGAHPLLEAAVRAIPPPDDADIEIAVRSDAPAGASAGTSAAVVVALLGALNRVCGRGLTPRQIAYEAHAVETKVLGGESGIQDQLCAALGGINFIDVVDYPRAVVTRLPVAAATCAELERRLALVYLGRAHSSSAVHRKVLGDLERAGPGAGVLDRLRKAAEAARDALLHADFSALGRAMSENTTAQMALHADLVSPDARRIIEVAKVHSASGWKVNGAGGDGGSITLLGDGDQTRMAEMIQAIERLNPAFRFIPVALSADGLRVDELTADG
jgi:D-glycero-alpha-D-manno-heptose-7-phosphate kinase